MESPKNQQLQALGVPVRERVVIAGIRLDSWVRLEREVALLVFPILGIVPPRAVPSLPPVRGELPLPR